MSTNAPAGTSVAKNANMAAVVTLQYAPVRPRSAWQITLRRIAVLLTGIGSVGWCGYEAQKRVRALESNRQIGPVDWVAVVQSPTLLKAAWQLSSNPSAIGKHSENLDTELSPPFRFSDGKAHFDLVIRNRGDAPAILPPYVTYGVIPRSVEGCTGVSCVSLDAGPWLGSGVRVLMPGESTSLTVSVPAFERPVSTWFIVSFAADIFRINAGGFEGRYAHTDWSEVPASAVQRIEW